MRKGVSMVVAVLLAVTLSGCLEVHRPIVPSTILTNSENGWRVTNGDVIEDGKFAPKAIETRYVHDPDEEGTNTFPALLVLVGLRTITRLDEAALVQSAEGILNDELANAGVAADTVTRETGSRTIDSGAVTQWILMQGDAESDSLLFAQAQEIRVFAEAWFDEASNTHVVAIAIAQTGGTDLFGQIRRDLTVWSEIVGDSAGSIEGAVHSQGFIDHVHVEN